METTHAELCLCCHPRLVLANRETFQTSKRPSFPYPVFALAARPVSFPKSEVVGEFYNNRTYIFYLDNASFEDTRR